MLLIVLIIILLLFSMFFSASESAFLSINKLRIRFLRSKKNVKAERVGKLLDKKEKLLNTVLIADNIVNIAVSSILTSLALSIFGSSGVGIATVGATVLLLLFGEITPKTIAVAHPEPIAFAFSRFISFFVYLFTPIVYIFTQISRAIMRLLRIPIRQDAVSVTEEEIKTLIEVGEEEGVVEEGEKKMLHQVFKFTDLCAKDIMIPRTSIETLSIEASYADIITLAKKTNFSRFPVYGKDIDDIQGILYIKDFLFNLESIQNFSIRRFLREPVYIFETKNINTIQHILREKNQSLAVILDEYSGTAGLLTIEDLVEEIFGGIQDEYTVPGKAKLIKIDEHAVIIDGATRLIDLSERLQIPLVCEYYDTIGGYITEKIGDIPEKDSYIIEGGFRFTVLEVEERHITKVKIERLERDI